MNVSLLAWTAWRINRLLAVRASAASLFCDLLLPDSAVSATALPKGAGFYLS